MSAYKYPSIFSRQMEAIVYIFTEPEANNCFSIIQSWTTENNWLKHKNRNPIQGLFRSRIILLQSLHVSLHRQWISYSSSSAVKQSSKTLRKINSSGTFVLPLLTSSTVVIVVPKWVALVSRKTDFGQSIWPAGNQRNHCVYDSKLPRTRVL